MPTETRFKELTLDQLMWIQENENFIENGEGKEDIVDECIREDNVISSSTKNGKIEKLIEQFEAGNDITDWDEYIKENFENPNEWENVTEEIEDE